MCIETPIVPPETRFTQKHQLYYEADERGNPITFKSWLGNALAPFYDRLMEKMVVPKQLDGDFQKHSEILQRDLKGFEQQTIIELGTGTGITAHWLHPSNAYVGVDISPALLKRAVKKFRTAGFEHSEFYILNVERLPFPDSSFDVCLCILTLNFFEKAELVLQQVQRVLESGGLFYGVVPVPERNTQNRNIEGRLRSEPELQKMFTETGFRFTPLEDRNGCLLYFCAEAE